MRGDKAKMKFRCVYSAQIECPVRKVLTAGKPKKDPMDAIIKPNSNKETMQMLEPYKQLMEGLMTKFNEKSALNDLYHYCEFCPKVTQEVDKKCLLMLKC
jgi:hypothetical protein